MFRSVMLHIWGIYLFLSRTIHSSKTSGGGWSTKSQRKQQETHPVNQAKNSIDKKDKPDSVDTEPSGSSETDGRLVK